MAYDDTPDCLYDTINCSGGCCEHGKEMWDAWQEQQDRNAEEEFDPTDYEANETVGIYRVKSSVYGDWHDCVFEDFPCNHECHPNRCEYGSWDMQAEGLKFDQGKPDYSLLPADALEEVVRVYDFGVKKYERDNWRKGLKYSRIFGAIMRHLWAFWRSEEKDAESGLKHLAQAAWGCLTLLEYTKRGAYTHFDDRCKDDQGGIIVPPEYHEYLKQVAKLNIAPELLNCDHEWVYDTSYGDTAGLHTKYKCKKCQAYKTVDEPPASVSIPSCWTPQPYVPYTITVSGPPPEDGVVWVMQNGNLIKVKGVKVDQAKEGTSESTTGQDA